MVNLQIKYKGQGTVEYILVSIVVIAIVVGLFTFLKPWIVENIERFSGTSEGEVYLPLQETIFTLCTILSTIGLTAIINTVVSVQDNSINNPAKYNAKLCLSGI